MRSERISPSLVVGVALLAGIWGDTILRSFPLGINVALWVGPLVSVLFFYSRYRAESVSGLGDDAIPVLAEALGDFEDAHKKPILKLIRNGCTGGRAW